MFGFESSSAALKSKNLPDFVKRYNANDYKTFRDVACNLFAKTEYGIMPHSPEDLAYNIVSTDKNFCAGKATLSKVELCVKYNSKSFTFPVYSVIPNLHEGKIPFFVHINFRDSIPDKYLPAEEIIDRGYAVLMFCYSDVTSDDGDFTNGFAGVLYPDGVRKFRSDCGKIAIWSWAASRVLDYALTIDSLDKERATVIGHSRLGKTALLTGALDHRFYCAVSNDSGCCGSALHRGKNGERIVDIMQSFPYWFCTDFSDYIEKEDALPFDQHLLIALNHPHYCYIASAIDDTWADPESEFLSCFAAAKVLESFGCDNAFPCDNPPQVNGWLHQGTIGYHVRSGSHYLSRLDWNMVMNFLETK